MRGFTTAVLVGCMGVGVLCANAQTFTYQGKLSSDGMPANGPHDMRFTLYDQVTGGTALSTTVCLDDVEVVEGMFTVSLPIATPTTSTSLYLAVEVRADVGDDCSVMTGYSNLEPRQAVQAAPAASVAYRVSEVTPVVAGAVRFNASTKKLEFFDGDFWYKVDSATAVAPRGSQTWTSPGTYQFVVPGNIHSIWMDVHGAGGGGGDRGAGTTTLPGVCQPGFGTYSCGGGSGAGGSYGRYRVDVTPGETLTIIVGAGGAAGAGTPGGSGLATVVRRNNNTTDLIIAPGGGGGGRRNSATTMGSEDGFACANRPAGGAAGATGGPTSFFGTGLIVAAAAGPSGLPGFGPSCYASFNNFCSAEGGSSVGGIQFAGPGQPFISTTSRGGAGAGPTTGASAGGSGKVYFWWD